MALGNMIFGTLMALSLMALGTLWHWEHYGTGNTMALGILWHWEYYGNGNTMALGTLLLSLINSFSLK